MKNKILLGALLLSSTGIFTACSDDNGSNPTLIQPTEFVLNTPSYINEVIDLENTEALHLTWSQPKYTADNAPINATYEIQVSPTNKFTASLADAEADTLENIVADYAIIDKTSTLCSADLAALDLNTALMKVCKWEEDDVPETQKVYLRMNAYVLEGTKKLNEVKSNVIELNVNPYYIELKDADPVMWYLVGNMFGNKWGSNIGVDCFPMFLKNTQYDKKTGTGEIQYLNYFETGEYKSNGECDNAGFKIQPADFNWDYGMTGDGSKYNTIICRNGGSDGGHIVAGENGYYLITMNTATNEATMVKQDIKPANYGTICLAGDFNGWSDQTPMQPYNVDRYEQTTIENHAWCYILEVTPEMLAAAGRTDAIQVKFRTFDSSTWWGCGAKDGEVTKIGTATTSGSNLGIPVGNWIILFNDISGDFNIIEKK